jgi:hypothetical protein
MNPSDTFPAKSAFPLDGGCTCRAVRYRLSSEPMFVHCCHCRWCQRETGSAFALNAIIEADRVQLLQGAPQIVDTPSLSGRGQRIARCPTCRVAVWSHYAGAGQAVCFVRVGTLDEPDRVPPDIHIFTESKQPWVLLPPDVPAVRQYYDMAKRWPAASLARRAALRARRRAATQRGSASAGSAGRSTRAAAPKRAKRAAADRPEPGSTRSTRTSKSTHAPSAKRTVRAAAKPRKARALPR